MPLFSPAQAEVHAGHDHGAFGELLEHLIDLLPLPEKWQAFLSHFLIDTIQIFFLLFVVMTVIYFLSSYINMDHLHHKLVRLKSLPGFLLAAGAGVLSPFCSCSIIPILIGMISVGVPVSVCLCYLTASSLLNITALLSLLTVAGPGFFTVYLAASLGILCVSSILFFFLAQESGSKNYGGEHHHHHEEKICGHCFWHRLRCALLSALAIFRKCALFILLGVLLSSGIMTFFSVDAITRVVNENRMLSVTLVSLIGLPVHSDIFSISPLLTLLLEISPPVALGLALSTMALSIPTIVILTRALRGKTVVLYCGVILALTLAAGWIGALVL